jgi:prolycopene isomerase
MQTLLVASSAAAIDWTGIGALASGNMDKKNFPVVVIGAGLGGLVSAAYLAKYGFDVTLLEQHRIPGGYATSFTRKNGKYTFDVSLHATVAEHAWPQMILSELGVWDGLKIASTPELRRIVTPDFDITLPAKNPAGVKQELSNAFPHEKKGIHGFYAEMEAVIAGLQRRTTFTATLMQKLQTMTLNEWMEKHVKDPAVKQCLALFSGYFGLGPSKINALFYAIATGEYVVHGGQYYKTRSQDLSYTLARVIEDHHGRIHYRKRVENILFDKQHGIKAVKDSQNNRYPAKAVIANCSVPAMFDSMLPTSMIPPGYKEKLARRSCSLSSFIVWLGLNSDIKKHVKEYNIKLYQNSLGLGQTHSLSKDLADSDIAVNFYDNLFHGYSKPGTSTMTMMTLSEFEPWKRFQADYFKGNKTAYRKEKQRIAERFIEKVESRLVPGLKNKIEVMEIGTPLTNMRYTNNTNGAIYGYDRDMQHLNAKTPIKGLYLASAWSHGGGYTPVMMAGREAATTLLKDLGSR